MEALIENRFRDQKNAFGKLLASYVVPIYFEERRRPVPCGTGFFVSAPRAHYLVSAAHVLEAQEKHDLFFYISRTHTRTLAGQIRLRGKKLSDIGVVKLSAEAVPPYPAIQKMAVPFDSLTPALLPRKNKQYIMTGFPGSKGKPNPIAKNINAIAYSYWGTSPDDAEYAREGLTAETHVELHIDRSRVEGPDGRTRTFPDPSGMSGSPVWMFFDTEGPNDARRMPLVAVATRYLKTPGLFVATDIREALDLMHDAV